jgi:hypothetical protein
MAEYLPLNGGTLTGPLLLNRDPQLTNEAATKHYVDMSVVSTIVRPPTTSTGNIGDIAGLTAIDSNYIYYCSGTYDGNTKIWSRATITLSTW